jgi:hypothetical protein
MKRCAARKIAENRERIALLKHDPESGIRFSEKIMLKQS